MKFTLPILPIQTVLPELKDTLDKHRSVVLSAEPGSGKTTIAPLSLLDATWLKGQKIIMLEPRRLAARMAAFSNLKKHNRKSSPQPVNCAKTLRQMIR